MSCVFLWTFRSMARPLIWVRRKQSTRCCARRADYCVLSCCLARCARACVCLAGGNDIQNRCEDKPFARCCPRCSCFFCAACMHACMHAMHVGCAVCTNSSYVKAAGMAHLGATRNVNVFHKSSFACWSTTTGTAQSRVRYYMCCVFLWTFRPMARPLIWVRRKQSTSCCARRAGYCVLSRCLARCARACVCLAGGNPLQSRCEDKPFARCCPRCSCFFCAACMYACT